MLQPPHWLALSAAALATTLAGVDIWRCRRVRTPSWWALFNIACAVCFLAYAARPEFHPR